MDLINATVSALQQAGLKVWEDFLNVIPSLIVAVIVFLIGYIIAEVARKVVQKVMEKALIDKWVEDRNLEGAIGKTKVSRIAGQIVKWYIVVLFLSQVLTLIRLEVLSQFVFLLVKWIPVLIASIVLILLGLLFARYLGNKILKTQYAFKKQIQVIVEVIIAYAAIVLGLENMGFKTTILNDLFRIGFTVFAVVAALVFGVAFAMSYKKEIMDFAKSFKR